MSDVAKSFKMQGYNIDDDPVDLLKYSEVFKKPCLLILIQIVFIGMLDQEKTPKIPLIGMRMRKRD